jgi:lipoic acid synthetase
MRKRIPRPEWLKIRLNSGDNFKFVNNLLEDLSLHTVCQEARCPNIYECFNNKTATFMILGSTCSRRCGFCSVEKGVLLPPDPDEPGKVARAIAQLGLEYAVITSVTRDDLEDEGAGQFVRTIEAIREANPGCAVELLIPDFNGNAALLERVLRAQPDVLGHNIETVPALYRRVRPQAGYDRSLEVLRVLARYRDAHAPGMKVKSGIMVGLGETDAQIRETMADIQRTGCDVMTIGQYLSPLSSSLPVERFYSPEEFLSLRRRGIEMGFKHVESGPLVRSSYHAKEQADNL